MNKYCYFLIVVSIITISYLYEDKIFAKSVSCSIEISEDTINTFLKEIVDKYAKNSSISYNIEYFQKSLFKSDTIHVIGKCHLVRSPDDTLFGAIIWIQSQDGYEVFYDLNKTYLINNNEKRIIVRNPKSHISLTGNILQRLYNTYFINISDFNNMINNPLNEIRYHIDSLNINKIVITIKKQNIGQFTDITLQFNIDLNEKLIERIITIDKFQEDYQYCCYNISNIVFNNISINDLKTRNDSLLNNYEIKKEEDFYIHDNKLLQTEVDAPKFNGINFQTKQNISLVDMEYEVLLLDFWYLSCYPCIQSIPHMVALYNKYKEDGLQILGINSVDNNYEKKGILSQYIENNHINYPIVLTDKSVDSLYNINYYPTYYLINKNGIIIYAQDGYSYSIIDSLKVKIEEELKK